MDSLEGRQIVNGHTGDALSTEKLCKNFGALQVTNNIDFHLPHGCRHALIGPNGSGKTTLINLLGGALTPTGGKIFLEGEDITSYSADRRVARGLTRTFQINTLFPRLTPIEAVTMVVCQRRGYGASLTRSLKRSREAIDEAYEILTQLHLADDCDRPTAQLAYGRQRLLEIALALAARPKVLLLDEPAAGVPQQQSGEILSVISSLPSDIAVLFIEHDIDLVFRFAERITVLVAGKILCEGTPAEIAADPEVRRIYLGDEVHA
jgi:ABC-type branched-subunit amino acid transport system ATPase component